MIRKNVGFNSLQLFSKSAKERSFEFSKDVSIKIFLFTPHLNSEAERQRGLENWCFHHSFYFEVHLLFFAYPTNFLFDSFWVWSVFWILLWKYKSIIDKTGVINDPLGQTHSLASGDLCFLLFCFARSEKWGRTDGRMDGQHVRK